MATYRAIVASPVGLHARPAAVFVRAVVETGLAVTIAKVAAGTGAATDARSILGVLALDVGCGDEVELTAVGPTADCVLAELAELLAAEIADGAQLPE
ncbi:MAG: HPr family phosphocarrier protein [Acidothermaceae bacterium]